MCGLTEAIHALIDGQAVAIVSITGKRYTRSELEPKKLGSYASVINDVGMTKEERKGAWRIDKDERKALPAR